ncbi:hypothetical protein L150_05618, partial [Candida albicans Ca529L]
MSFRDAFQKYIDHP